MRKSMLLGFGFALTVALAAPPLADAQAIPRGSTSSSGSSSSGSSSGSSSSGPVSSGSSSSSSGSTYTPPPPPPDPPQHRSAPSGSSSSGSASQRTPPSGSSSSGSASSRSGGNGGSTSSRTGSTGPQGSVSVPGGTMVMPRGLRDRDGRPIVNQAVPRTFNNVTGLNFPLFGPWGRYYPWFGTGFGWNYGFVSYSPFIYGNTAWLWNRYGFYDPYGLYGYGYDPYRYYDPYNRGYGYGYEREQPAQQVGQPTGSLRLRVNPSDAKVYVDGTLMGIVDDFDGLSHHLDIPAGTHTIEFRADGYETYSTTMTVDVGRTLTLRASLNRKK